MQSFIKIFSETRFLKIQSKRFKQLLYLYLIFRALFWMHQYDLLFGEHHLVYSKYLDLGNFKDVAFILLNSHSTALSLFFLIGLFLLSSFNLFFEKYRFLPDVLICLIVLNLHYKIYSSLTGGDFLINQLLFFNIFLSLQINSSSNKWKQFLLLLHNGAVLSIIIQICIVYFLAGLAKLIDVDWQKGMALIYISDVEQFKLIPTPNSNYLSKAILIFLNYLILLYQILFAVLVFIKRIKKPVLVFGIAMHAYIILFMGLFWFGLIMMICYIFFWPIEESKE